MGCFNSKVAGSGEDAAQTTLSRAASTAERVKSITAHKAVAPDASPKAPKEEAGKRPKRKPSAGKAKGKTKSAAKQEPALDEIPVGEPVVPLVERAVHHLFLAAVSQVEVELEGRGKVKLGDLYTHEVVSIFVKPQTLHTRMSLVETLALMVMEDEERAAAGQAQDRMLTSSGSHKESGAGSELKEVLSKYRGWAGGSKPFQGPVTYFLSHAWCYKLGDLRDMAKHHYEQVTGSALKYASVFYWIDIFAVSQNFTGDFTKHPDGNFPSVIQESEGVVFTMYPWNKPIAPTRIWCLFEAVTAVESGVSLELLIDSDVRNSKLSLEQLQASFKETVQALDIGAAQATVESDRQMILEMVRSREGGIPKFNQFLQQLLDSRMQEMLLFRAVAAQDTRMANTLLSAGATFFHRHLKFKMARITDASADIIAGALKSNTSITSLDLSPPNDKGLLTYKGVNSLAGALLQNTTLLELDLSYHRSLGDEGVHALAVALGGRSGNSNVTLQTLKLTKTGMDDAAASELASVLQVNSTLTNLDLASNDEIREEGACALLDGLHLNTALKRLDLTTAKMTERSVWIALGNMLKYNTGLEMLVLAHCGLSAKSVAYLGPGLEENKRLMVLDLSKNPVGGKGVAMLSPFLARNQHLLELMLTDCGVDAEGAEALKVALRSNNNIIHVGLAGNKVCRKEWDELTAHTSNITTLVSVDAAPRGTSGTGAIAGSAPVVLWVPPGMAGGGSDLAASLNASSGGSLVAATFKSNLALLNSRSHLSVSGGSWTPLSALFSQAGPGTPRPGTNGYGGLGSMLSLTNGSMAGASSMTAGRYGSMLSSETGGRLLQGTVLPRGSGAKSAGSSANGAAPLLAAAGGSKGALPPLAPSSAGSRPSGGGMVTPQKPPRPVADLRSPSSPDSLTLSPGPLEKRAVALAAEGSPTPGDKRKASNLGSSPVALPGSAKKSNLSGPARLSVVSAAG